jgi:hypothetical protein
MANRSCHDELISKAAGVTAVVLALACYALVFIPWATNQDRKDQITQPDHRAIPTATHPEHTRLARQRITRDAPDLLHMIFGAA